MERASLGAVRWWLGVCAVALTAGCGAPAGSLDDTGPLTALPECDPPPTAVDEDVEGLTLPVGAVLTSVTPQDPLVSISAYVGATPVQIRRQMEARRDLEVILIEDEIFESEMLVSDGEYRTFLRASALCATGSGILGVVAPEASADALPVPPNATPVSGS